MLLLKLLQKLKLGLPHGFLRIPVHTKGLQLVDALLFDTGVCEGLPLQYSKYSVTVTGGALSESKDSGASGKYEILVPGRSRWFQGDSIQVRGIFCFSLFNNYRIISISIQ